jgi:hypothetical protein
MRAEPGGRFLGGGGTEPGSAPKRPAPPKIRLGSSAPRGGAAGSSAWGAAAPPRARSRRPASSTHARTHPPTHPPTARASERGEGTRKAEGRSRAARSTRGAEEPGSALGSSRELTFNPPILSYLISIYPLPVCVWHAWLVGWLVREVNARKSGTADTALKTRLLSIYSGAPPPGSPAPRAEPRPLPERR